MGDTLISLHEKGIEIRKGLFAQTKVADIHFSQIIDFVEVTETELKDKSVLGRALVGAVLLGGVGAIVGGISGTGSKKSNKYFLILNFWDKETRQPCSLSLSLLDSHKKFVDKANSLKSSINK